MTESSEATEFVTGESHPTDFTVDEVLEHLAKSDQAEVDRVLAQESAPDGENRVGILEGYQPPAPPTAPTPETLASQPPEGPSEVTEPVASEPVAEGPALGDEVASDFLEGYGTVLVSTDGLPTEATEAAEAAKVEDPIQV